MNWTRTNMSGTIYNDVTVGDFQVSINKCLTYALTIWHGEGVERKKVVHKAYHKSLKEAKIAAEGFVAGHEFATS